MADQSDVETMLTTLATGILYPDGADAPSLPGPLCRIFRGWPNAAALDADLAAGHITVTIFPDPGQYRVTTRYIDPPAMLTPILPTLTASIANQTVTFAGTAVPGQVAGLLVDNAAFVHRTAAGDTPSLVAAILASYIRTRRVALLAGASLTIPGAGSIIARVVADQSAQLETRRQTQGFRLSCWCPDPATRDTVAASLDVALSQRSFITLPDLTSARLRQTGTITFDQSQNANLYRRDLLLSVEYATIVTQALPSLLFGDTTIAPNAGPVAQSLLG